MVRVFIYILIISLFSHCESKNFPQNCTGEWFYWSAQNTYCEILITEEFVLPYHKDAQNLITYKYHIRNDSFYLIGNDPNILETSPIYFLGEDSFQIKGITPSILKRIQHSKTNPVSLLNYHNKINKLISNRNIVEIVDDNILIEINNVKKQFDEAFTQRRIHALSKRSNL
ncbi:MAG: hypothetical protein MK207_11810 [Saprospiraceae bacterium]|nr:hypothetical protein [Saprospiraceae bacterium]